MCGCLLETAVYSCVGMSQGCKGVIQQLGQHSATRCGAGSAEVLFVNMDDAEYAIYSSWSVQKVIYQ